MEYAGRVQRKRAIVFLISDFLVPDFQRPLRLLARRHDVVAVRIVDPRTRKLPRAGLLHLRDLETGRSTWVDSSSRPVRDAYALAMHKQEERLMADFRRAGVDHMDVRPEQSVADPIVRFFRMRELRGAHR